MTAPTKTRIAINGFGRIGRLAARIILNSYSDTIELVAVNDLTSSENLAYLLQNDSTYRRFDQKVSSLENQIIVENKIGEQVKIQVFAEKDPALLPWKDWRIDTVLECTGLFLTHELAEKHIQAGAKRVILSAPAKTPEIPTVVQGVNYPSIWQKHNSDIGKSLPNRQIISNASCTTNCIAPALKMLSDTFGIESANALTVHAYTATQALQDGPSKKDWRDGRAAAINMIPSKTGAAKAVELALPELKGKLNLASLRVPIITGSLVYMSATLSKGQSSKEELNQIFAQASQESMQGILEYSTEEMVSSDIIGNSASCILDSSLTEINGNTVKLVLWYDNEWGYANRLVEMIL